MAKRPAVVVGLEFEETLRKLLRSLGFDHVAGGPGFRLGEQIDACAGIDDTLVVVECKTGPKVGKPILDDIKLLRGKTQAIINACQADPAYKRYKSFKFAVATNFPVRDIDLEEARREPQIGVWDRTFLDYYEDLLEKLGPYARFNLAGEIGIEPRVSHEKQYPAFRAKLGNNWVYLFYVDPADLLTWCYVARREIGRERYYQRLVEKKRLAKIREFVEKGGFFPNSAIVAFESPPTFTNFSDVPPKFPSWPNGIEFGCVTFPATYRACWIVDGQHRLYGIGKVKGHKLTMPIVAMEGLGVEDQATVFLDINKNQKTVQADLVWDLEGEMRPHSPDGIVSRVAKELNQEGLLSGRIYIPLSGPKHRGQLKLSGVCSAIKKRRLTARVLEHKYENPLFDSDPDKTVKFASRALLEALTAVDQTFPEWQRTGFWLQNSGIAILMALVEHVVSHLHRVPSSTEFARYWSPLSDHMDRYQHSMRELRQRCNSEGGRDEVAAEFARAIRAGIQDPKFAPTVPESEYDRRIRSVERGLADVTAKILSSESHNWFKERVPEGIRVRVIDLMRRENAAGGKPQDFLDFGQVGEIVRQPMNWKVMEHAFVAGGGFSSQREVEHGFEFVNRLRGRLVHGRADVGKADENILEGVLQKFESVSHIAGWTVARSIPNGPESKADK